MCVYVVYDMHSVYIDTTETRNNLNILQKLGNEKMNQQMMEQRYNWILVSNKNKEIFNNA